MSIKGLLPAALVMAAVVPAVAAAYTLINLFVVIAMIGQTTGMLLPSQTLPGTATENERPSR
jgi:hypothetical protein